MSSPAPCSVYVYYRLREGGESQAAHAVDGLLTRIADATGVRGRLLVKRDEPLLWMEVYEAVCDCDAFVRTLAREAAQLGFDAFLHPAKPRVIETFVAARCA